MGLFALLARQARWVLVIGVFTGMALPCLSALLRPWLVPVILVMLTGALLRLDWRAFRAHGRDPRLLGSLLLWLLLASPLLSWALLQPLPLPMGLKLALVLNAAAPPILSSPVFAQLLGLDAALAFLGVVSATLILPLSLALLVLLIPELVGEMALPAFLLRVSLLIGVPFLVAMGLRRGLGAARLLHFAPLIDGVNVVFLLVFAMAIMDGINARLGQELGVVLGWLAAACVMSGVLHLAGYGVFYYLGRRAALSVAIVSGNRNMGLMMAVTAGVGGGDFALYVAVAQVPMYCVPLVFTPLVRRWLPAP